MNQRQAKKVLRLNEYGGYEAYRYTDDQIGEATRKNRQAWWRKGGTLTRGWRWGRWDEQPPTPPWVVPF